MPEGRTLKRIIVGLFLLSFLLIGSFLTSLANATVYITIASYYGHWGEGYFYPLNETMYFDAPAENLTCPGPYPYVFTLNTTMHVYLEIRHFLWAYNENCTNHLTIWIDNQPVLQAYSPRAAFPNNWYPGGNGVQLIDLGTRSAGTHLMTMTCNISDYYIMNWWAILSPFNPPVPHFHGPIPS
jgi:hypothetical protein